MEEITLRVNKTVLFVIAGLVAGFGLGFGTGHLDDFKLFAKADKPVKENVVAADNQAGGQPSASPQIALSAADHFRGPTNAKVVLVEYSDFQCPYCQKFHPTIKKVYEEYGGKVSWVYRHFPLSFHANAQIAAEASECAAEQGKFWEYADMLFEKGSSDGSGLTPPELEQYAKNLKLDFSKFESCLASHKYTGSVSDDLASGGAAGVDGTPATILVNEDGSAKIIPGGAMPYETLKAEVDAALAK